MITVEEAGNKEEIYLEFHNRVSGYIRSRISNPSDAEDLLSCVFLKIYQHIGDYDAKKASLSTWIYAITKNTVNDYLRKQQRERLTEPGLLPVSEEDISEGMLEEEQLNRLADALEKLEERERDLIILHYYKELPLKQIARQMGMSYSNTKIIHHKALHRLQAFLSDT